MPSSEKLLPRATLFNAALYGPAALMYTVTIFALETIQRTNYVFISTSIWRSRFDYLAICSWPLLLFGALILIAVRVGANVRRKRTRRKRRRKKRNTKQKISPSSSAPHISKDAQLATTPSAAPPTPPPTPSAPPRTRVPSGFVSVTRLQRTFAAFGFLWVSGGLAMTSVCAAFVYIGLREFYDDAGTSLGNDRGWVKRVLIPAFVGIVMAVLFGLLALSTFAKLVVVMCGGVREAVVEEEEEEKEEEVREEREYEEEDEEDDDDGVFIGKLENRPDDDTVERLLRQLRDLGFVNIHENMAALQASSFDLEIAADKLTNAHAQI